MSVSTVLYVSIIPASLLITNNLLEGTWSHHLSFVWQSLRLFFSDHCSLLQPSLSSQTLVVADPVWLWQHGSRGGSLWDCVQELSTLCDFSPFTFWDLKAPRSIFLASMPVTARTERVYVFRLYTCLSHPECSQVCCGSGVTSSKQQLCAQVSSIAWKRGMQLPKYLDIWWKV